MVVFNNKLHQYPGTLILFTVFIFDKVLPIVKAMLKNKINSFNNLITSLLGSPSFNGLDILKPPTNYLEGYDFGS